MIANAKPSTAANNLMPQMEFHELQSIVESNTLLLQALGNRMAELADSIEQTNQSIHQTNQNVNGLIQTGVA